MSQLHDSVVQLDLNLLTVFDALLRERSVTRAAKTLGLTQSSASHSLARLRTFFDDPLFVKTHRGISPTDKGQALSNAVMFVMETVRDQVLSQSKFDPKNAQRTFRIALSDMGELVFLPTLIEQFKKHSPYCRIQTIQALPEHLPSLLGSGECDLAMGSVLNASDGLHHQQLFTHTFVCIISAKNRKVGKTITLEQYEQMPHVAVTLTGQPTTPYDRVVEDSGVKRDLRILTPHFLMIPLLLDQHPEYIATVPRELGSVFQHYRVVRMLEPPMPLPAFALNQYWHPRFHNDKASRWLRELTLKTFTSLPPRLGHR